MTERSNVKHEVLLNEGTLSVVVTDTRKWYEYIGIDFGKTKITVYIPAGDYGALSVKTDTGNIKLEIE